MRITIDTGENYAPDWAARGTARVVQNVRNLLGLLRYDVAYNRTLGLPVELTDLPLQEVTAQYAAEVAQLIEDNEPRASIISVTRKGVTDEGEIIFEVVMDVVA